MKKSKIEEIRSHLNFLAGYIDSESGGSLGLAAQALREISSEMAADNPDYQQVSTKSFAWMHKANLEGIKRDILDLLAIDNAELDRSTIASQLGTVASSISSSVFALLDAGLIAASNVDKGQFNLPTERLSLTENGREFLISKRRISAA